MITINVRGSVRTANRIARRFGAVVKCKPAGRDASTCEVECNPTAEKRLMKAMMKPAATKVLSFGASCGGSLRGPRTDRMQEGRVRALLDKQVRFRGRLMTKRQMIEEMRRLGGTIQQDRFPKYIFSRAAYNRMNYAEQRAYDEKLKTKMPFAVELPDGTFFEVTKTEADYFTSLGGDVLGAARRKSSDRLHDMDQPNVLNYDLDRDTLTPIRSKIDTTTAGDYGADPAGEPNPDGTYSQFRMVPSGDIVSLEERNRRLDRKRGLRGTAKTPLSDEERAWREKFSEAASARDLSTEMTRLREKQPRPLAKLYGQRGPTPEQRIVWEEHNCLYTRMMAHLRRAHKIALERDNAAFRAGTLSGSSRQITDAETLRKRLTALERDAKKNLFGHASSRDVDEAFLVLRQRLDKLSSDSWGFVPESNEMTDAALKRLIAVRAEAVADVGARRDARAREARDEHREQVAKEWWRR